METYVIGKNSGLSITDDISKKKYEKSQELPRKASKTM
jgi:hypothetical protein